MPRQAIALAALLLAACTHTADRPGRASTPTAQDEFFCDDTPELDRHRCGLSRREAHAARRTRSELRAAAIEHATVVDLVCGPEGEKRNPDPPRPIVRGPDCRRWGWDAELNRYRAFCEGEKAFPSSADPWLWAYRTDGASLDDAQVALSDDRTNGCD